jgi:hypothetical protein
VTEYEVVPVEGHMVGGHHAVRGPGGKLFGVEFGLDKYRAGLLQSALIEAYRHGQLSGR